MSTYHVTAERGEHRWVLQAVEAPGAISEVTRLDQAGGLMREAISFVTGEPEADIEVVVEPQVSPEVRAHLARASELEVQVESVREARQHEQREAVRLLRDEGLSFRDMGVVLGVSHQRVEQVLKLGHSKKRTARYAR